MTPRYSSFILSAALSLITAAHAVDNVQNSANTQADNPIGRFEIARFEVEGNTLLEPEAMRKLLAPFAGMDRDFGHVQRALEALEAAYHRRGFKVVQVILPEQELNNGVVRLQVVETRIGKIIVQNNQFVDEANVRRSLPALRQGAIPDIETISASLRMANQNSAKKVSLQLQGSDRDGEIDAILKVTDEKPWTLGLNLDNSGNSATGDNNIGVLYQHANIGGFDHVLSLQYMTTVQNPSRVGVYGVGYHIPLYAQGDSVDLFGSYSDVDSGTIPVAFPGGPINVQITGSGTLLGARYNQMLTHEGDYESKLVYGIDYKAYQSDVRLFGAQLRNDVTVRPLSLSYVGSLTPAGSALNYYVSAVHNLPGGEDGSKADFNTARVGAPSDYKLLRYGVNFNRLFAKEWQIRMAINGQYTADALIPAEQFGAGGAGSVRGYNEREVSNDAGYFASAEVYTPDLCGGLNWTGAQCRMMAFADGAQLFRKHPQPGDPIPIRQSISSIGLGMRIAFQRHLALQLDLGHALATAGTTGSGSNRVHFKMNLSY